MGTIIKYSLAKGDDGERIKSVVYNSGSTGYPTNNDTTSKEKDIDITKLISVNLWGNDWHGIEDLTGNITVTNGDIYLKFDEEDFDPDVYEEGETIPSASIYVDGKVNTSTLNADNINFNYPEENSNKQNLRTVINDQKGMIVTNTQNILTNIQSINNLTTKIQTIENRYIQLTEMYDLLEYITIEIQESILQINDRLTELETNQKDIINRLDSIEDVLFN